jgi:hypothetical protein
MRTDRNGCSTCPVGAEQYEEFEWSWRPREKRVQYDYRDTDGKLFTCVSPTLEICRARRDEWKLKKDGKIPA